MNFRQWIWCLHCQRCFSAFIGHKPQLEDDEQNHTYTESVFDFAADFEMQLGVEISGQVYAECPYEGCDGDLKDFWWWETYERDHPNAPEVPDEGKVYPLYP